MTTPLKLNSEAREIPPPVPALVHPMTPELYRLGQTRRETADTFTIELEPVRRNRVFSFSPGQFNMLYQFGMGEAAISISGNPTQPGKLIHTIRAVGTVTRAIGKLKAGATVGIRGPFGNPWPVKEAAGNDIVLVAGGIGLAPLRPALYHILEHREDYGGVALLYGTRTPEDIIYRKELEQWRGRLDLQVHATVDRAPREWKGNVGAVPLLASALK